MLLKDKLGMDAIDTTYLQIKMLRKIKAALVDLNLHVRINDFEKQIQIKCANGFWHACYEYYSDEKFLNVRVDCVLQGKMNKSMNEFLDKRKGQIKNLDHYPTDCTTHTWDPRGFMKIFCRGGKHKGNRFNSAPLFPPKQIHLHDWNKMPSLYDDLYDEKILILPKEEKPEFEIGFSISGSFEEEELGYYDGNEISAIIESTPMEEIEVLIEEPIIDPINIFEENVDAPLIPTANHQVVMRYDPRIMTRPAERKSRGTPSVGQMLWHNPHTDEHVWA